MLKNLTAICLLFSLFVRVLVVAEIKNDCKEEIAELPFDAQTLPSYPDPDSSQELNSQSNISTGKESESGQNSSNFSGKLNFAIPSKMNPFLDQTLQISPYGTGEYFKYAQYLDPDKIRLILEVGSRDAVDAIRLGYYYNAPVYAFECNPEALRICYSNVRNYPYVSVMPYACWNETTLVPFYPVVRSHGGRRPVNLGGSSLLVVDQKGCETHHEQGSPIHVPAIRLDEWLKVYQIDQVDLLCMDCQGATLQVLQGLGESLKRIKYIISEVYFVPCFEGAALYPEIKTFLMKNGFEVMEEPVQDAFCDVLFINKFL